MPITVAELVARFGADTSGLQAGVASSKADLAGLDTQANKTAEGMGKIGAEAEASAKAAKAAQEQMLAAGKALAASIEREIALYGKDGKAAVVAYDTAKGALARLGTAEKEQLNLLAKQYDETVRLGTAEAEAAAGAARAAQTATAAAERETAAAAQYLERLEREIALYGDVSKAAEISYDLQKGALAGLTAAEKEHALSLAKQYDRKSFVAGVAPKPSSAELAVGGMNLAGDAAAGLTAAAVGTAVLANDFQSMTQRIANNTTMNDTQIKEMRDTILSLGKGTGEPFEQLAMGYMHVANFGFKGAEATKIMTEATKSAVATGSSAEDTANILANTLHEFSINANDAGKAMNVLHDASALGNTTLQQFDESASVALGVAANFKVSLTDVSAAMTALTQHGYDAARASTQVQDMLVHISAPSPEVVKTLTYLDKMYGSTLVKDFSASGLAAKGLHGVLADVQKVIGGNASAVQTLIPALRGGLGAMTLVGTGAEDYRKDLTRLNGDMSGKFDPTQKAFNATMGQADRQFKIFVRTIEADLIPAGMKILPVLTSLIPLFKDVADDVVIVVDAFAKLPEPVQKAIIMFGAGAAISKALGINFGGVAGFALKLIGGGSTGLMGVKMAGTAALDTFGIMATESTAVAAGLGAIGLAAAGAALDIYLIKRDADVAIDALNLLSKARDQDAATAAGYAGLNKTGDAKRNMIGTAAQINSEEGDIRTAIAGRDAAIKQYSSGFTFDNQLRLKAIHDRDGLQASLAAQEKNRRALLADADKVKYTSHSAPYKAMQDAATDRANAAAANAGPGAAAVAGGSASRDSILAGMKAQAAEQKAAAKAAREAASERKKDAAEALREAQQRAEQAKNYIGDMQEEIKLWGNDSREAKLFYEIAHGGADYLATAAQRSHALSLAHILDTKKEADAESQRFSGFADYYDQAKEYRKTVALGTEATDRQSLAWDHANTVIDTLTDKDQAFIKRAWASEEVWAGRAQATTLAGNALEAFTSLQDGYADKTTETLGTVKTAAEEAAIAIAKALDPAKKLGISIDTPDVQKGAQGVMAAAVGADTAHAADIAKKWQNDLTEQTDTVKERLSGVYDPATKAVDAWLKTNHEAIQQLTALIGNDKALQIVDAMKQQVASIGSLDHSAAILDNYKAKVADLTKQYQEMSASSPFDAWKNSILEYDKATGTLGEPFGEDDLKKLYNYEQGLKDIQTVAKGLTDSLFSSVSSAFQPSAGKQQEQAYNSQLQAQQYSLKIQAATFNTSTGIPNPYTAELNSVDQRIDQSNAKLKSMGVSLQNTFRTIFTGIVSEFDSMIANIAENALKGELQQGLTSVLTKALGKPIGLSTDPNAALITSNQANLIAIQANTANITQLISALQASAAASAQAATGAAATQASGGGGLSSIFGDLGLVGSLIPGFGAIAPFLGAAQSAVSVLSQPGGAAPPTSSADGLYTPSSSGGYNLPGDEFGYYGSTGGSSSPAPNVQNFSFNVSTPSPQSFVQSSGQIAQAYGAASARAQQRNGK